MCSAAADDTVDSQKWSLVTTDARALAHVLHATDVYQKPEQTRKGFGRFLGKGVLFSEGAPPTRSRLIY